MKTNRSGVLFFRTVACAAALLATHFQAHAASDTWVGDASVNWTGANWTGGNNPPLAGDALFFGEAGSSGTTLVNGFLSGTSFSGITFNSGASAYTMSPNWTRLTGDIVNNSSVAQTLNLGHELSSSVQFNAASGPLQFLANNSINVNGNTLTVAGAYNTTINITVGGGGANSKVVKNDSGTLTFGVNASFQGGLTIHGGAVRVLGLANLASNSMTVNSGGTLVFAGNDAFGGAGVTVLSPLAINGGVVTTTNKFTTLGPLTLNGGTLNGAGGVNADYQMYSLEQAVNVGGSSPSTISGPAAGGTTYGGIHLGSSANATITFNVADATLDANPDLTVSAALMNRNAGQGGGAGSLAKTGAGTLVLSGANIYTGSTLVQVGTLHVNGGTIPGPGLIDVGSLGNTPSFILSSGNVTAGGQFVIGAHGTSTGTQSGGSLTVNAPFYIGGYADGGGGTGTYTQSAGTVSVTGGINFNGGGPNHGVYNLNGGMLTVNTIVKNGGSGTGTFNFNGGTLTARGATATFLQNITAANVQNGGAVIDDGGFAVTIAQNLLNGGSGGLNKLGGGTLTLSGANTFIGDTKVSAGTLALGNALALQNSTLDHNTYGGTLSFGALAAATFGGLKGAQGLALPNSFALTLGNGGASAVYSGALSGTGATLTKTGGGTQTLSGVNTYSGNTLVTGGTLSIGAGGSLSNTVKINAVTGGTLAIAGTVTIANNGNFGIGSGISGTTGTVTVNTGGVLNIGGGSGANVGYTAIGGSDAGNNGQYGSGTLTINDGVVNVAAGGTGPGGLDGSHLWLNPYGNAGAGAPSTINLNGGTLSSARQIASGSNYAVVNFNGGALQAAVSDTTGNFLTVTTANVRNGGAVLDPQTYNLTLGQTLIHSGIGGDNAVDGGLTKNGSGTLTLTATGSSFNGNVTVSQGTLVANGQMGVANPVTSTLGNPQRAGRLITVEAGGTLSFLAHDVLGNAGSTPQVALVVNGGGVNNGSAKFITLGPVTLNAGTLTANGGDSNWGSYWPRGTVTVTGTAPSAIAAGAGPNARVDVSPSPGTTFDVADVTGNADPDLTIAVPIGNPSGQMGMLVKTGPGTLALTAVSSHTGGTQIGGGTVRFATGALGGSGTVAFSDNAMLQWDAGNTTDMSSRLQLPGAGKLATLDVGSNPVTLAAAISGAGGLAKRGSDTLTLSGGNSFTGNIVIDEGILRDTVQANNANPTVSGLGNMTTVGRTITINAGATLLLAASDTMGSFQYKTPVVITVNGGTLANEAPRFMSIGDIVLQNGGRITTANGAAAAFQTFNLRGSVTVSGASGCFFDTTGTVNYGIHLGGTTIPATTFDVGQTGDPVADLTVLVPLLNEVYNTGALIKAGAGRMIIAAAPAYTGTTTINGGTLLVNANHTVGGAYGVSAGVLGGNGAIGSASAAVTVGSSGILTAGDTNTTATLSVNGNVSFLAGGKLVVNIQPGGYDQIEMVGGAGTFTPANGALDLVVTPPSYLPAVGTEFTIVNHFSGGLSSTFNGLPEGTEILGGARSYVIHYDGAGQRIYLTARKIDNGTMFLMR